MCFTLRLHMAAAPTQGGLTQALGSTGKNMEFLTKIAVYIIVVLIISYPARLLGKRIYASGIAKESKWRCDLGQAIHRYSLGLMVAIGGLVFVVIPRIFGFDLLGA